MALSTETMKVEIKGDTEGLRLAMEKGSRAVANFSRDLEHRMNSIDKRLTSFGANFARGLISTAAIGGGIAAIKNALGDAGQIADTAEKIGISAEKLQELRFAAEENGSSFQVMDDALAKFSIRLADARKGQGELADILKKYGIQTTDAAGRVRSMTDIMRDVADVVTATRDPAEQLNIVTAAFGQNAGELVNILRKGSDGLDEMAAAARNAGQVMDEDLVQKSAEIDDSFNRLSRTIGTQFKGAILEMVSVLYGAGVALDDFYKKIQTNVLASASIKMDGGGLTPIDPKVLKDMEIRGKVGPTLEDVWKNRAEDGSFAKSQKAAANRIVALTTAVSETNKKSPIRALKKDFDDLELSIDHSDSEARQFAQNFSDDFGDAVTSAESLSDAIKKVTLSLAEMALKTAGKSFLESLLSPSAFRMSPRGIPIPGQKPSPGNGFLDNLLSGFGFANGGVMTSFGPLSLRKYSNGGVANSPQLAMFGEGRTPEAYVPLPDGRSIPVTMQGGAGVSVNQNISIDARGADEGFIRRWPAMKKEIINETKAAVAAEVSRGGSYAKKIGRR